MFLYPEDVDQKLNWMPGTALRMARRRRLPHIILPDGSVRFEWSEIEPLLVRVAVLSVSGQAPEGGPHAV